MSLIVCDTLITLHSDFVLYSPIAKMGIFINSLLYSKTCVKRPISNIPQTGFQDQLSLNAGQKHAFCITLTFIKIFVLTFLSGCFTQILLQLVYTICILFYQYAFYEV